MTDEDQRAFDAAADQVMIRATPEDQADPWRMRELKAKAEREGKHLVLMPKQSFHAAQIAEGLARREKAGAAGEMRTVSRDDHRAISANLADIAAGRVAVV